ncbi:hypothetical protein JXQ31_08575 [candidate division KSB1 bacterium]|nr:hypothetical protein [candidate division KSB1 bacterium]
MENKKPDICAALACEQPKNAVPIWELEFHLWNCFSPKRVILGTEFLTLSSGDQEKTLHENAEIMFAVSRELQFSALTIPGGYWEIAPGVPAYYWLPDEARIEQTKILKRVVSDNLMLMAVTGGVLAIPEANDYISFSTKLLEAPEEIDDLAQRCWFQGIEQGKKFSDLGVEGLITASDIAENRGPYFNPEQLRRFIFPYLHKWALEVKSLGVFPILHTDGNVESCLDEIAQSGISALQAIDPVAGMDIIRVKNRIGDKVCLCGNVDCGLFLNGTPEQIYKTTTDVLQACKTGGGFVLGASNVIQPQAPKENVLAMIEAWRHYGSYKPVTDKRL